MDLQNNGQAQAEALKAEGNVFYRARKYREAYVKYSEAIEVDDKNVVLYTNRASAGLELQESVITASSM